MTIKFLLDFCICKTCNFVDSNLDDEMSKHDNAYRYISVRIIRSCLANFVGTVGAHDGMERREHSVQSAENGRRVALTRPNRFAAASHTSTRCIRKCRGARQKRPAYEGLTSRLGRVHPWDRREQKYSLGLKHTSAS